MIEVMPMTITGSALTALFIGLVWTLIKVVEYFIKKNKEKGNEYQIGQEQSKLFEICKRLQYLDELESVIDNIEDKIKKLDEMHSVYDENRVPKWYVQSEILMLVRQIHNKLDIFEKELEEDIYIIKNGQTAIIEKILDLLNAQKLMVERLGDLIRKLNKISK